MKNFKQWLKENNGDPVLKFRDEIIKLMCQEMPKTGVSLFGLGNIARFGRSKRIEQIDMEMFKVKKKGDAPKIVKDFYNPLKKNIDALAKMAKDKLWKEVENRDKYFKKEYIDGLYAVDDLLFKYTMYAENMDKMFDILKKGATPEDIAKLSSTFKAFDLGTGKPSGRTYFDPYTVDDINQQIDKFKGTVRLSGSMDLYIKFNDKSKVTDWYF